MLVLFAMQACGCALLLVGKRASGRLHFAGLLAAINRRSCQLLNAANCTGVAPRCRQRFSARLIQPPRTLVLTARRPFTFLAAPLLLQITGKTNARNTNTRQAAVRCSGIMQHWRGNLRARNSIHSRAVSCGNVTGGGELSRRTAFRHSSV